MGKPTGKIASLPAPVRQEINHKIRDGWGGLSIADWIWEQVADRDIPQLELKAGDALSIIWTCDSDNEDAAKHACENAISRWFNGPYKDWLKEEAQRDESVRLVERVEGLGAAASTRGKLAANSGAGLIVRSMLLDALLNIRNGSKDPQDIARLANAFSRLALGGAAAELAREKLETTTCEKFLVWFKDEKARSIAESNATNTDKIAALRKTYFADVDQLEESGEVNLPK
jgi:hypothetical protein